jgi:hypothetical protein
MQNLSYYISKAKSLNDTDYEKEIRIALLSSFIINGLEQARDTGVHRIKASHFNQK